ncbi:phospholipid/glycerol acyltransferase [Thermoanaerobacter ethanolicus JW 200]|nr:phospholipid/glycerol acyltransferase [Thermoanaerobacter ethanolicus JW 200]
MLKNGNIVGVFPEGGVSVNGNVKEFKPGFGFLSVKTNAPILPIAIIGTERVLPPGKMDSKKGQKLKFALGNPYF